MSDRKLLKKVRDGDKEALSDIIKQYYADVFSFLSLHDTERRRFL